MGYTPRPDKLKGDKLQTDIRWQLNKAHDILAKRALADLSKALREPDPVKRTAAIGEAIATIGETLDELRKAMNYSNELDYLYRRWLERGPYNGDDD